MKRTIESQLPYYLPPDLQNDREGYSQKFAERTQHRLYISLTHLVLRYLSLFYEMVNFTFDTFCCMEKNHLPVVSKTKPVQCLSVSSINN